MLTKVNLNEKLSLFQDHWSPKIIGSLDGWTLRLVKLQGEFVWHHHKNEDELFLVLHGALSIKLRDGEVRLGAGELVIVPRGVEHMPVAEEEVHALLFEPRSTLNTGNVRSERTISEPEQI